MRTAGSREQVPGERGERGEPFTTLTNTRFGISKTHAWWMKGECAPGTPTRQAPTGAQTRSRDWSARGLSESSNIPYGNSRETLMDHEADHNVCLGCNVTGRLLGHILGALVDERG